MGEPIDVSTSAPEGVHFVGEEHVAVLPMDEASAMVGVAKMIEGQAEGFTQRREQFEQLVSFGHRLHDTLASTVTPSAYIEVSPLEEQITTFLLLQTRARADLPSRLRQVCKTCGAPTLVNPDYERLKKRRGALMAVARGVGLALSPSGVTPFFMVSSLIGFGGLGFKFVCRACNGLEAEESVVVFCPQCKTLHTEAVLATCSCGHDFVGAVSSEGLWRDRLAEGVASKGSRMAEEDLPADVVELLACGPSALLSAHKDRSVRRWQLDADWGEDADGGVALGLMWRTELESGASSPRLTCDAGGETVVAGTDTKMIGGGGGVWRLDSATGAPLSLVGSDGLNALALRSDGGEIAAARLGRVELLDVESGTVAKSLAMSKLDCVTSGLAYSPDGSRLIAACASKVWIWNLPEGECLLQSKLKKIGGRPLWTADGDAFILSSWESIRVLNAQDCSELSRLDCDPISLTIALSSDRSLVASGRHDNTVHVYELDSWRELYSIPVGGFIRALTFACQDRALAVATSNVEGSAPKLRVFQLT